MHELRDPAIYEEDGRLYLFYAGAGESNICVAELVREGIWAISAFNELP